MRNYKRWTKEEDLVILGIVKENPENLVKAFILASKKLDRSEASIRQRWYNSLRDSSNPVFMVYSNKKAVVNGKNITTNTSRSFFAKLRLKLLSLFE